MRIYLSGPITGMEDQNEPAFMEAAKALEALGHDITNPALFPAPFQEGLTKRERWVYFMKVALIKMIRNNCTHLVLLPGWEKSEGCAVEVFNAQQFDMKILLYPSMKPIAFDL